MDKRTRRPSVAPPGTTAKNNNDPPINKELPEPIHAVRVAGNRSALLMPIISLDNRPPNSRNTSQEFIISPNVTLLDKESGVSVSPPLQMDEPALAPLISTALPSLPSEISKPKKEVIGEFLAVLTEDDPTHAPVILYRPEPTTQPLHTVPQSSTGIWGIVESIVLFFSNVRQRVRDIIAKRFDEKMGL